ncbi:MAG: hypothetical protein AAF493_29055 [Pseudomonadota bacterium]
MSSPSDSGDANPQSNSPFEAFSTDAMSGDFLAGLQELSKAYYQSLLGGMTPDVNSAATSDRGEGVDESAKVLEVLGQAHMAWMNQAMRYWTTLSQHHALYLGGLIEKAQRLRNDPSAKPSEHRALLDEAAAYLREVADLTLRESRILQREFDRLALALHPDRETPTGDTSIGEARRYARAKQ